MSDDFQYDAVRVSKGRGGGYLITLSHTGLTVDLTSSEWSEAASSLPAAKRIAREKAVETGYVGPFRWQESHSGWVLTAYADEGDDDDRA